MQKRKQRISSNCPRCDKNDEHLPYVLTLNLFTKSPPRCKPGSARSDTCLDKAYYEPFPAIDNLYLKYICNLMACMRFIVLILLAYIRLVSLAVLHPPPASIAQAHAL